MQKNNIDALEKAKAANKTRERLLEKAENLFAQRGYHAVEPLHPLMLIKITPNLARDNTDLCDHLLFLPSFNTVRSI